jgi:hypothetical protein
MQYAAWVFTWQMIFLPHHFELLSEKHVNCRRIGWCSWAPYTRSLPIW